MNFSIVYTEWNSYLRLEVHEFLLTKYAVNVS